MIYFPLPLIILIGGGPLIPLQDMEGFSQTLKVNICNGLWEYPWETGGGTATAKQWSDKKYVPLKCWDLFVLSLNISCERVICKVSIILLCVSQVWSPGWSRSQLHAEERWLCCCAFTCGGRYLKALSDRNHQGRWSKCLLTVWL